MADQPEPSPPAPGPADAALLFAILLVTLFLVGSFIQLANLPFGLLITELFLFFAPAYLITRRFTGHPLPALGFGRIRAGQVALGALIGLANYPLSGALEAAVRALVTPEYARAHDIGATLGQVTGPLRIVLVVGIAIAAPFCEETAFRGFIQPALARRMDQRTALIISSALFAGIHFESIGFAARTELGLVFGLLAAWSGSIWPSIAAHSASNLFATALFYGAGREADVAPQPLQLLALAGLGVVLTLPLLVAARSWLKPPPPPAWSPPAIQDRAPQAWLMAFILAVAVMVLPDRRGVALNYFDGFHAAPNFAARLPASERERFEHASGALRDRARRDDAAYARYRVLRNWMHTRDLGPALTQAQAHALVAEVERWVQAGPAESTALDAAAQVER